MERRTKTGNKMGILGLSDPTGHFEAVLFSEGLAQYRDVLEPGAAVLLQLGAELQGEDVRARVLHAEPLDDAAAKTQKGLRIFVRDTTPPNIHCGADKEVQCGTDWAFDIPTATDNCDGINVPIVLVRILARSSMFGMVGICPGLKTGGVNAAIGDDVRSRSLLPDCTSQSETWPIAPMIAIDRPSPVNSACIGISVGVIERNSRPVLTSQILTWLPRVKLVGDGC